MASRKKLVELTVDQEKEILDSFADTISFILRMFRLYPNPVNVFVISHRNIYEFEWVIMNVFEKYVKKYHTSISSTPP